MRILILNYEYPPVGGGGGVGSQQYAEAWARNGHQVEVLTSWHTGLAMKEKVNGVLISRVRTFGKKNRATATFLSMVSFVISGFFHLLKGWGRYKKFNVINTHFSVPTGPLGLAAQIITGVPNVLTIIGGDIYDPTKSSSPHRSIFYRLVNKLIINNATRVISISSDTVMRTRKYYKITRKIVIIPYGFPLVKLPQIHRQELGLAEDKYYLISIGRLVARKGFKYFINALKDLPYRMELIIIGDGPLEGSLKSLAKKGDLENRVHFVGPKFVDEKFAYLVNSDCYVLSSIHEGLGIVIQEAMHAGLPIVSTNNGGQIDLIKDGKNGLLVDVKDSKGLACAIKKVYDNKKLAERFSKKNKKDIQEMRIDKNCLLYIQEFQLAAEQHTR